MKVLLNCPIAFALAHGGAQIQIEQTAVALKHNGVDVDFLKWWDGTQKADLIHHWGRMPADHIRLAQQKGIRVVMGELLTATGSRTPAQLRLQKFISQAIQRFAPRGFIGSYQWESYRLADAFVALTPWEKHLMEYLFDAAPEKVFVVGNGVEDVFLNAPSTSRGPWLICTATITERKRVLELAQAAVQCKHRSGSLAGPMPKLIPTRNSFTNWPVAILKPCAMKAGWMIARSWPESMPPREVLRF